MSDATPTPGTHLRKNRKQITAMLKTAVSKAGLEWSDEPQGSNGGLARGSRDGAEAISIAYTFTTNGLDVRIERPGAEPVEAPGLYTDTTLVMEALRVALESSAS